MTDLPGSINRLARQLQEPQQLPAQTGFCPHCLEDLPFFVSDELAGRPVDEVYPEIAYHLDLCESCLWEYVELAQLTASALSGEGKP